MRIDKKKRGAMRLRRSTLIRQRQSITHFIDSVNDERFKDMGQFRVALEENGLLFRYNLGKKHKKLRVFSGTAYCH